MQFEILFQQMRRDDGLIQLAEDKICRPVERFSTKPTHLRLLLKKNHFNIRGECHIRGGDGFNCDAGCSGSDAAGCITMLAEKIERQLRKQKEKTKSHKVNRQPSEDTSDDSHFEYEDLAIEPQIPWM